MEREGNGMKEHRTLAQNKLLILYFLKNADLRLSEFQLIRFIEDNSFMNYFDLMECVFELIESGLVAKTDTVYGALYEISEAGEEALGFFESDLRKSVREQIDDYCSASRRELSLETETHADYIKLREGEYRVSLRITEQLSTVFELNATVYSREDARRIVENWRKNAVKTYRDALTDIQNF